MGMEDAVKELYRRREKAKLMGGEKRVKRQHNRGRLTARERLEKLLDPDVNYIGILTEIKGYILTGIECFREVYSQKVFPFIGIVYRDKVTREAMDSDLYEHMLSCDGRGCA